MAESPGKDGFQVDRRVMALSFARMADGVGNSFLIIVIPLYVASDVVTGLTFGLEEAMITGIILSLFGFLNSSFQPLTGRLSDRTGRRRFYILIGLAGLTVTNLAYVVAGSYLSLVVVRALQGISVAFIVPASIALVNEVTRTADRGGSMGIYNTFRLIGFGAGPLAAGAVVDGGPYHLLGTSISGFDATFYIAAVTAALSYVLVRLLITDPDRTTETPRGGEMPISIRRSDGPGLDPVFTLGLATLLTATAIALFATIQPSVNERLAQGSTWFGVQFAAFILAQILLQTPVGRASDIVGRRPFIVGGMLLMVPTTLLQGFVTTSETMFVARLLQGIAGAMLLAPSLALAGDLAKEGQSGGTLSVLTMAFGLGIAFGPLTSGFLIQYGFAVPFAFGAVLTAIGTVLVATQVEETIDATPIRQAIAP